LLKLFDGAINAFQHGLLSNNFHALK